jgi:hypothetical protein
MRNVDRRASARQPAASGRPRARPHDKFGFYRQRRLEPVLAGDAIQKQVQGAPAELTEILADRRQWRQEECRFRDIVEAHHADIAGDVAAVLGQGAEEAERHRVVFRTGPR